jgi:hypothetical protein
MSIGEKNREWRRRNPEKVRQYERNARAKNPQRFLEKATRASRKFRGYPQPTHSKPAQCECCGGPPGVRALHLDHDHVTGAFRGWLCHNCNLGIGRLGDTIESLEKAIEYLKGHRLQ